MSSQNHVAIITGAAQGIGLAISEGLMKEGYRVCLADVNTAKGKESVADLLKKYGAGRAIFAECNVTSRESFEATFTKTRKEFGRIDVLVNNAGILDDDHPDRTVAINLMGSIIGCELAFKYIGTNNGGNGGSVVNVSSVLGFIPFPKAPVYSATKHAVIGLTRSYGDPTYLEKYGIIFTAMCPYYVITPLLENAEVDSEIQMLKPEFIAEGVIKLLKDKQNGSTMLALPGKLQYIGLQEELKDIIV